MPSPSERKCLPGWSLLWAFALFAALWLLDFPKPMVDDLFHAGAGLNLAGGGDFSNPLLARQQLPGHLFFYYPPVHPHAIAAWLKVFGISAAALTAYQVLTYFITTAATIFFLRRQGAPVWLEWVTPLGVCAAFLKIGLRPEPLAVALTMAGLALVECGRKGAISVLAGFLLMALGTASAPRTGVFGAVVMLFTATELSREGSGPDGKRRRFFIFAIAGLAVGFLIFLFLIDFRLGEFLQVFRFHSHNVVAGGKLVLLKRFLVALVGFTLWPVLLLMPVFLVLAMGMPGNKSTRLGLWLACAFPCVAMIGGLGHGSIWYAILCLLALAASLSLSAKVGVRTTVLALVWGTMLLANSKPLFDIAGTLIGGIKSDPGANRAEAQALRSTPEHPLLLDGAAARYVFDYRLPPGSLDWEFAAPYPAELATDVELRPGDVFLIGPATMELLTRRTHLEQTIPMWTPLGLRRWAYPEFPRQVFIIPAENCGGLRGGPLFQNVLLARPIDQIFRSAGRDRFLPG